MSAHSSGSLKLHQHGSGFGEISSDGGSKRVESEGELLPDIPEDKDLDQLRQERDEVEEKLKETSRKLEAITWGRQSALLS